MLLYRLVEHTVHTNGHAIALARRVDAIGGECEYLDRRTASRMLPRAKATSAFDAIHERHLHVHEYKHEGRRRGGGERGKCFDAVADEHNLRDTNAKQQLLCELLDEETVLRYQNRPIHVEGSRRKRWPYVQALCGGGGLRGHHRHVRQFRPEHRAAARQQVGLVADRPTKRLCKQSNMVQTETCSRLPARSLLERLPQLRLDCLRHAGSSVRDRQSQVRAHQPGRHRDGAVLSVFESVGHEIDENEHDPRAVGHDLSRDLVVHIVTNKHVVALRHVPGKSRQLRLDDLPQVHRCALR
mmetsp:Transcript_37963/g.65076  ORF Transcript_37963/g.65076 Transcript_37963/m.65076 type:complete len:298 (+) Transcript_37963:678-1571(+)